MLCVCKRRRNVHLPPLLREDISARCFLDWACRALHGIQYKRACSLHELNTGDFSKGTIKSLSELNAECAPAHTLPLRLASAAADDCQILNGQRLLLLRRGTSLTPDKMERFTSRL